MFYEGLARLSRNENVFFIATTLNEVSLKYDLYSGNRSPMIVELSNPEVEAREKILRYYLGEKHNLHDVYIKKLTSYMVNQSPRALKQFVSSVRLNEYSLKKNSLIEEIDCEKMLVKMKIKRSYFSKFLSATKKMALTLNKFINWPVFGSFIAGCIQLGIIKYNYDAQINFQREMLEINSNYHLKFNLLHKTQ
jgi:SpoVK/Ycf46/Vps4 family AAA+-type ATPase